MKMMDTWGRKELEFPVFIAEAMDDWKMMDEREERIARYKREEAVDMGLTVVMCCMMIVIFSGCCMITGDDYITGGIVSMLGAAALALTGMLKEWAFERRKRR